MTIVWNEVDIVPLESALISLKDALKQPPNNDLERDGVIQRFEYTFELSWKMIRRCLQAMGRQPLSASPKPLFRDALREGFIDDIELWFEFLNARNNIAHMYSQLVAKDVYEKAKNFPKVVEELISKLIKYGS